VSRRGGMENLSVLVGKVYPGRGKEELAAIRVFGVFMRALSPRVLRNARPVRFARGILTVHTSNSAWANSLQLESESILLRLRRHCPGLRLHKLVFRSGPMPDAALPIPEEPEPKRSVALDKLPAEIARELRHIHDDALREAVVRAALMALAE
jgi:Dna[CI] antecedent, DciA